MYNIFMTNVFLLFLSFAFLASAENEKSIPIPPKTVDKLVVSAYLGRWFQVYSSFVPISTYEKGGVCVTADYTSLPSSDPEVVSFTVVNSQRLNTPDGKLSQVDGVATNKRRGVDIETGKFFLSLNTSTGQTVNGNYWIIDLSPINVKNQYSWAVVSAPFKTQLFVLTRDVAYFKKFDETFVLNLVKMRGFTTALNKPIETKQTEDCIYAPLPI